MLIKLIELEWRKLEKMKVIGEVIVYWLLLMFAPVFFLKVVFVNIPGANFGASYESATGLMLAIHLGFLLFGASMINHVFIEEYKNKTMALSFGYPLSRQKLVMAKVLFIALVVFICTFISFLLAGITTYIFDLSMGVIEGAATMGDLWHYLIRAIIHSAVVACASFIPLFLFGLWKRMIIPTVVTAIFLMQALNFSSLVGVNLHPDLYYALISLLGVGSVYLSVKLVNRVGDI